MTNHVDLSGLAFGDVDGSGCAGEFINYLDNATGHFHPVKRLAQSYLRLKPGERVLDVGCGCGGDIREMAISIIPNGYAVGIDVSRSMIEEARQRSARFVAPSQFVVADAEALPWASAYFDACLADRIFQHLRSPARALNEMLRVIKTGGRVVVADRDWGMGRLMQPTPQFPPWCSLALVQASTTVGWEGTLMPSSMKQECRTRKYRPKASTFRVSRLPICC